MLIDVTRLIARRLKGRLPTGVDRVALAYVEHFALGLHGAGALAAACALVRIGRLHLTLPAPASRSLFLWLLSPASGPRRRRLPWGSLMCSVPRCLASLWAGSAGRTPRVAGSWVVNAAHSGLEHAHWARRLRQQGARSLIVIHDLIPITHPQFCRIGEADRHARRIRHALGGAGAVVVNSQATLDALAQWACRQGLPMPPAAVAHLGAGGSGDVARDVGSRPLAAPYFVMLATLEPRKNHVLLLGVWERLVQRLGPLRAPRLVLIGQLGWEIEPLLRQLRRTPALQGIVLERPLCSDAEVARWLAHAQAMLMPSFVEGFGMPLVEALSAGVPVLASDLPVFREIAGSVPDYLDPLDGCGWLEAIAAYAEADCAARDAHLVRLRGFRRPTWERHFETVDALLESVANADPRRVAAVAEAAGAPSRSRRAVPVARTMS